MVVVPTGKKLPEGTPVRVTDKAPAQESFALAVPSVASLTKVPHGFTQASRTKTEEFSVALFVL